MNKYFYYRRFNGEERLYTYYFQKTYGDAKSVIAKDIKCPKENLLFFFNGAEVNDTDKIPDNKSKSDPMPVLWVRYPPAAPKTDKKDDAKTSKQKTDTKSKQTTGTTNVQSYGTNNGTKGQSKPTDKSVVYGEFRQIFKDLSPQEQNEVEELRKLTNAQNAIQYYISCEKNYETAKSVILQLN